MAPPLCLILYVEDEPGIRAVAQMALEAVGRFSVIDALLGRAEPPAARKTNSSSLWP